MTQAQTFEHEVRTTCPYCGVGCGVLVSQTTDGVVQVKGDPDHPANYGRLCSKGSALGETVDLEGRLLVPKIAGKQVSWDQALDTVAEKFSSVITEHGPDAVAFYVSGQLLTEDYYVANKLMKGFIGSANIDTNSRLCMASSVAGHRRAFGTDTVPGCYEDLELADLIVLVGSNTAWCHPIVYQRIVKAKEERPDLKIVVLDPRKTATCAIADLHLPLRAGSDVLLFNGLLNFLRREDRLDFNFLENHTEGFGAAMEAARESASSILSVAQACGVSPDELASFYQLFAKTEKVVSLYSQGVNQSSSGTDKVNSIINCHLATGRIGKPGMGPFSITGQPNAMGGREVGGLANQLAAHMNLEDASHRDTVARFWQVDAVPDKPGLKAVDLFDAIDDGKVKAVWIMATNPVVSMPDAEKVRQALEKCEMVVVSDCIEHTDTAACADVLLPATGWAEKDGTVTNSERRISRQKTFLPAAGEAKHDWWIIAEVAKRMGFEKGFNYDSAAAVFREHAALSAFENNDNQRDFNISAMAEMSDQDYDTLKPIQWPVKHNASTGQARFFAKGDFYTPSRRARFVAVKPIAPINLASAEYPLVLNTGRLRDQWHTMTRTGKAVRLFSHKSEPFCEVSPSDAEDYGIRDGLIIRLKSQWGEMLARAIVTEDQPQGSVFVPIHWNDQFANNARVGVLVNPEVDPFSGQPELKHTPVKIMPYTALWHGFILSREEIKQKNNFDYLVAIPEKQCVRYELCGNDVIADWHAYSRALLHASDDSDWLDYSDKAQGWYRSACLKDGRLEACLYIAPMRSLPERDWLIELFAKETLTDVERMSLLAGKPGTPRKDVGRTVCSCLDVGEKTIIEAITKDCVDTVTGLGEKLKAGTNCGSCIPELDALLKKFG